MPDPLPCSLDSSAIGLAFVSQMRQASSCFKATAFTFPSGLKTLPLIFPTPIVTHVSRGSLFHPRQALLCGFVSYSLQCFPVYNVHSFTGSLVNFCLLLLEYKLHEGRNVYDLSQYLTHSKKILLFTRGPITMF